jgi:hypothetical protein
MEIIITAPFRFAHGGLKVKEYQAGDEPQTIPDDAARWALENKHAELPAKKNPAASGPLTMDEIVEAIGKMDKADPSLWTAANAPQVKALAEILGRDVTADQRNEAWAAVLQAEEEASAAGGQA